MTAYDPLDPRNLAQEMGIPVMSLRDLAGAGVSEKSLRRFTHEAPGDFSALTVVLGEYRLIVENSAHFRGRRTNSVAHELSHVLLGHDPSRSTVCDGGRLWDRQQEGEADWLAGELLIPRKAALRIARNAIGDTAAAEHYGVSVPLVRWRLDHSGARIQARRERERRRSKHR
ncbi:MAG: ImmA/IrrE family metallo-endopeptidase [Polyangiaceae bacterium]